MPSFSFFERRVYCLVRQKVPNPHVALAPSTRLRHDLGLDLLDRVLLGISLEERLRIEIPDTELDHWHTLADVLACVARHRAVL